LEASDKVGGPEWGAGLQSLQAAGHLRTAGRAEFACQRRAVDVDGGQAKTVAGAGRVQQAGHGIQAAATKVAQLTGGRVEQQHDVGGPRRQAGGGLQAERTDAAVGEVR
jgi:hypothetical protein